MKHENTSKSSVLAKLYSQLRPCTVITYQRVEHQAQSCLNEDVSYFGHLSWCCHMHHTLDNKYSNSFAEISLIILSMIQTNSLWCQLKSICGNTDLINVRLQYFLWNQPISHNIHKRKITESFLTVSWLALMLTMKIFIFIGVRHSVPWIETIFSYGKMFFIDVIFLS